VNAAGLGLVSPARKLATVMLTKLAVETCAPGDVVETGVYTGGTAAIIMRVLMEYDECNRKFFAFDSFQGLPQLDRADTATGQVYERGHGLPGDFAASREDFEANLKHLSAWDDRIRVTKGWFNESIPTVSIEKIAFLRLDGDLYASTITVLRLLYHRVMSGGIVYVDDYGSFAGCKAAVDEFRSEHGIESPMHEVDEGGRRFEAVWWRK